MVSSNPVLCGSIAARPGSFGVAMHTAAYRALGLNFVYVAFGTEDTAGAMAAMRALGIRGLGLTMPHKVRAIDHLDALTEEARAIGAVNTVVNDGGRLVGHNVDWSGAVRAFSERLTVRGCRAAVVGAGGGARAIVYGLVREEASVTIFNRSRQTGRGGGAGTRRRLRRPARGAGRGPRLRPDRPRHAGGLRRSGVDAGRRRRRCGRPRSSSTPFRGRSKRGCSARPRPAAAGRSPACGCNSTRRRRSSGSTPARSRTWR